MRRLWTIGLLLMVAGCKPAPECRKGTLFLTVELDGAVASADHLQVLVDLGDSLTTGEPFAHAPGTATGTIEVDFAGGYPAGKNVTVTVRAIEGTRIVGHGSQPTMMSGQCSALSMTITSDRRDGGDGSDGGTIGGDGGISGGDGGGGDGGTTGSEGGAGPCNATNCPEGFCADGICCDKPCEGQCEACDVPGSVGTCTAVTGAPHGQRAACAGAGGPCGGTCDGTNHTGCTYPDSSTSCGAQSCSSGQKLLPVSCDGAGGCPAPAVLSCTPPSCNAGGTDCASTCSNDSQCASFAGKPYCDHGACTAHLPNGRTCGAAGDCNSGFCVDAVCCDQACGGQCQACDVSGSVGTCAPVTSGAPHGTRTGCGGSGVCAGSCAPGQTLSCTFPTVQCAGGTCASGSNTPAVFCSNGSCPSTSTKLCGNGLQCNSGGTACLPGPCTADGDCRSGFYCATGGVCTAQHVKGDSCNLTADCAGQSNCRECDTGVCADGHCCNTACNGQCEACDVGGSVGTCTAVSGAPHAGRSGCGGTGSCAGSCDGVDTTACSFPTVQCVAQTCSGGLVTFASSCKNGSCVAPTPPTKTCPSGQICSGANCSGCTTDAQCGAGKYCDSAGTCQTQKGDGLTCGLHGSANADCYASGNCGECAHFCVDGFCCNTACNGQCQNCNSNPGSCTLTGSAAAPAAPVSNAGTTRPACGGSGSCQQVCNGGSATQCADPNPEPTCFTAVCSNGTAHAAKSCGGGSCPASAAIPCSPYICNPGGTACLGACAQDSDCVTGYFCAAGGVCTQQKALGAACALSGTTNADCYNNGNCGECGSGNCVDGVCCNTTCINDCERCDAPGGTAGTCHTAPAGSPTGSGRGCLGVISCRGYCDGASTSCTYPTGSCSNGGCTGTCARGACIGGGTKCGTTCCECGCVLISGKSTCKICM